MKFLIAFIVVLQIVASLCATVDVSENESKKTEKRGIYGGFGYHGFGGPAYHGGFGHGFGYGHEIGFPISHASFHGPYFGHGYGGFPHGFGGYGGHHHFH